MSKLRRLPACIVASVAMTFCPLAVAAPPESEPAPAEPADATLPAYDVELPSYEEAPSEPEVAVNSPLPEAPRDGNGSTVVGAMLIGGGATLAAASAVLFVEGEDPLLWGIGGGLISSVSLASGVVLLITGLARRRDYKPWRLDHDPPPRGTGMIGGGTLAVTAGTLGLLLGGLSLPRQDGDDPPYGETLLGLGAVSVATGTGLLIAGVKRDRRFSEWRRVELSPSFSLLGDPTRRPGVGPGAGGRPSFVGASFGVAGRF